MSKLKVFSIVDSNFKNTPKSMGFDVFFESVLSKKIPLNLIINNGRVDGSYYSKLLPMIDYVKSCNDEDLILYTDAFDVMFLDNEDEILRKFKLTNSKFLISGEIFCYPFDTLQPKILEKTQKYIEKGIYSVEPENHILFRHPCAGMMMGYKNYFLTKLLTWKEILEKKEFPISNLTNPSVYEKSDQGACTIDYVNTEDFTRIDVYPRVFINHFCMQNDIFSIQNGKVSYQKILNSNQEFPSIIHFNGSSFPLIFDFNMALKLSIDSVKIEIKDNLLILSLEKALEKPILLKIYDIENKLEYESTLNNNESNFKRIISTKSITNNSKFKIELTYQGYTFFKQTFNN